MSGRRHERVSPSSRAAYAFVLITATTTAMLVACAGARPAPHPRPTTASPDVASGSPDAGTDAAVFAEPVPNIDALAARGSSEMPLMREVARSSEATKPTLLEVRAADACFRAAVAASVSVRAWFEDDRHAIRGAELSGAAGLVPPRGPACARKGENLRLIVEAPDGGTAITARAVVWQAP